MVDDHDEGVRFMRGVLWGTVFAVPIWVLIVWGVSRLW